MDYYQEITLAEQVDIDFSHILSITLQSIHGVVSIAKGQSEGGNIALAFPEYDYNPKKVGFLGNRIRCFGASKSDLEGINLTENLNHIADYVKVGEIKEVGDKATHYEIYTKYRHKSSVKKAEKLYNHLLKKYGQEKFDKEVGGFDAILANCEKQNKQLPYPYVSLVSKSSGEPYPLRIKREIVTAETKNAVFSGFGLSDQAKLSAVPAW